MRWIGISNIQEVAPVQGCGEQCDKDAVVPLTRILERYLVGKNIRTDFLDAVTRSPRLLGDRRAAEPLRRS